MDPGVGTRAHRRSAIVNGSEAAEQWPTLLGRMLENLSRVMQLELRLLEARSARSLMAIADRAIAALIILYAGVVAGCCLLAALVLLLHQWMRWWQCFALGGLVTIACGLAAYVCVKSSIAPGGNDAHPNEEQMKAQLPISEAEHCRER